MPIPGGFATAPTVTATPLATPSPGVQLVVSGVDASAATVTIWRSDSAGKNIVRGASNVLIAGSFTVDDFEAPIGELLTYTAVTFDVFGVSSDESTGTTITLSSTGTWLSDPLTPSTAVQVTIADFPEVSRIIDAEMLTPVGATAPIMIAGVRSKGAGSLTLATTTLLALQSLRTVIDDSPVILLRVSVTDWDIAAQHYGVQNVTERRIGKLAEPTRLMTLDVTAVQRPSPDIAGPLHTWSEVLSKGLSWKGIADADLTWLQLAQRGGL